MRTELVTPPTQQPVSLTEMKSHMRVTHTADDSYILGLIPVATEYVEDQTSNRFIEQTWKYYIDRFPSGDVIQLPFGEAQSITHLKYTDADDDQTTMSTDDYITDVVSIPSRIILAYGGIWPTDTLSPSNPIEIQFVAGYTTVPTKIKHAIKIYCAHLYENREPVIVGVTGRSSIVTVPMGFDTLISDYRMLRRNDVS